MVLIPAACGGRAQLELFEGESEAGSGGFGGSGSASGGSGAGGSTSSSAVSSSSVSVSSASTVSTSTGSSLCEFRSEDCDQCIECTLNQLCMGALDICFSDPECIAFNECLESCGGGDCFDQCTMQHPAGWPLYLDLIQCVFCSTCPNLCAGQVPPEICQP